MRRKNFLCFVIAVLLVCSLGGTSVFAEENLFQAHLNENQTYTVTGGEIDSSSVEIPESLNDITVSRIETAAFLGNEKIRMVTIPQTIEEIGDWAFGNCTSLSFLEIENPDVRIGAAAFENTLWLDKQAAGVVYIGNNAYTYKGEIPADTTLVLQSYITGISDEAFAWQSHLETVEIPSGVVEIGDKAFYQCENLTSVTIPASVETIADDAFEGCSPDCTFYVERNSIAHMFVKDMGYHYSVPFAFTAAFWLSVGGGTVLLAAAIILVVILRKKQKQKHENPYEYVFYTKK